MSVSLLSAWSELAALPLEIDAVELEQLRLDLGRFTRVTTIVRLQGGGHEGAGEDVTYQAEAHDSFPELATGSHTLGSFSERLEGIDDYRRWGIESAALDLTLRQAGTSLAAAVDREPRPVSFVISKRLGEPASVEPVRRWLELYPSLRFKLDPTSDWDDALVEALDATGAVDTVDLKGAYRGTPVDQPPDPVLYRRVAEGFPNAWIEDPALTSETDPVLEPHRDRITWDAPIHSVADVEALPFAPRTLNCKPSRFGSVRGLFAFYDYCFERGIGIYGGGQFELGPGRGQIQYLASLFHPDMPNDTAPGVYNEGEPRPGLPESPLTPTPSALGFRFD